MTTPPAKTPGTQSSPENCVVCGNQLPSHIVRLGGTHHPQCRTDGQSRKASDGVVIVRHSWGGNRGGNCNPSL